MAGTEGFCESGDHGVNVSGRVVPGKTLQEVLGKVHLDPAAPWTSSETSVELSDEGTAAEKIEAFTSFAKEAMEAERDDIPETIQQFVDGVKKKFGELSEVHLAVGKDLGAEYLIGKAADGWVAVAVQPYSD